MINSSGIKCSSLGLVSQNLGSCRCVGGEMENTKRTKWNSGWLSWIKSETHLTLNFHIASNCFSCYWYWKKGIFGAFQKCLDVQDSTLSVTFLQNSGQRTSARFPYFQPNTELLEVKSRVSFEVLYQILVISVTWDLQTLTDWWKLCILNFIYVHNLPKWLWQLISDPSVSRHPRPHAQVLSERAI